MNTRTLAGLLGMSKRRHVRLLGFNKGLQTLSIAVGAFKSISKVGMKLLIRVRNKMLYSRKTHTNRVAMAMSTQN